MVEIEKIRELVAMMVEHELTEMELRDGEQCVVIKRGSAAPVAAPVVTIAPAVQPMMPAAMPGVPAAAEPAAPPAEDGLVPIRSPMVGTFYASSDPDASPYVTLGSAVEPETIVCVIEAMKVFNNIKAECKGTIAKVLVSNGQTVEFGQTMFLVKP